jgi:hypothetical protein
MELLDGVEGAPHTSCSFNVQMIRSAQSLPSAHAQYRTRFGSPERDLVLELGACQLHLSQ